jgi:hypothetical protein
MQPIQTCKALVQQGSRKNLCCERPPLENSYCIYHQRNYEYESLVSSGKNLCGMFFRGCNVELTQIDIQNNYKNCIDCRAKKSGKKFPCQKEGCTFHISKEDNQYCKKHIRQLLHDTEQKENIIYCDIDRGCFNQVISGNTCDSCIDKEKQNIASTIDILRKTHNITATSSAFTQLHKQQEKTAISIAELWRCIQKNAYARGLLFTVTESDFEKCVIQPCYYCGFYSTSRLNGIDRIDNNKGYVIANCLPCCTMCNIIKNTQHPLEFLDKIDHINRYNHNKIPLSVSIIKKWKSYCSSSIRTSYNDYKQQSKSRNIEFLLSEEEYTTLIQGICYLCGISNTTCHTNGIDRINSSVRCYSVDNTKTCCGHCNTMKGILSLDDFIEKCKQINIHNCDRSIFIHIPIYSNIKCRNEFYTADDIYQMMHNGNYMNYIEWCKEKEKSSEFISIMNHIRHTKSTKEISIEQIRSELEKERSRTASINELTDKKHLQSITVYSYLTQGKLDYFKTWYQANYNKTTLFDDQLTALVTILPTLTRDQGIEACKKFIYDEKNRRVSQERRDRQKKVVKYSNTAIISPCINEIVYPHSTNKVIHPIVEKVQSIQEQKGYNKVESLKQWKSKQIFETIQEGKENTYKVFCEANNKVGSTWPEDWASFVLSVKGKPFEQTEGIIRAFVGNLRRLRHNELCSKKKSAP